MTRVSTVGELTTSVAHELNQPLGAILSNAEAAEMFLAADPPALDEVRDILADIRKDDQRASEVIRRMRGLLRKQELAPKSIEINEAVEEVLKLLSIDASARKVAMKFERTAEPPPRLVRPGAFPASGVELGPERHGSDGWSTRRKAPSCCSHRTWRQRDGENRRRRLRSRHTG